MASERVPDRSDVFLSYAREDVAAAEKLAALLGANGLTVWWDRRLVAGDAINDTIERAIDGASAVIVLWSPHAIASRWVNGEAETAAEAGKLLPVKIAECRIPLNFRSLHTPEVFRSSEQLVEMAELLTAKLRPHAAATRPISLSDASKQAFLQDLRGTLAKQDVDFWMQMRNEWAWCKRHPIAVLLICAAYFLLVTAMAALLEADMQTVHSVAMLCGIVGYILYRRRRLSKVVGSPAP